MKNSDLISNLTRDLTPVRRPAPWGQVGLLALFLGLLALLAILAVLEPRPDLAARLRSPGFVLELLALAIAGSLATLAAARLRIPGATLPLWNRRALAGAVVALGLGFSLTFLDHPSAQNLWELDTWGWKCAVTSSFLTFVAAFAGAWALRRGASTRPALSSALVVLAALCFGWLGISLDCPSDHALHLAVWHLLLPLLAGLGLGRLLGRHLLRW